VTDGTAAHPPTTSGPRRTGTLVRAAKGAGGPRCAVRPLCRGLADSRRRPTGGHPGRSDRTVRSVRPESRVRSSALAGDALPLALSAVAVGGLCLCPARAPGPPAVERGTALLSCAPSPPRCNRRAMPCCAGLRFPGLPPTT
jgi:hypothetical protein